MLKMTIPEFHAALKAQGVPRNDVAFKCVMCGKVQSMSDFIAVGRTPEEAERQIGFSCIGRWTGGKPAISKEATQETGCDWTLGGLFSLHTMEVIDEDGKAHPRFQLASQEEAQAHARDKVEAASAT